MTNEENKTLEDTWAKTEAVTKAEVKPETAASLDAGNNENTVQSPVLADTSLHPVKDKDGQTFTYITLGCGVGAIVFLAFAQIISIACSIVGIVVSKKAIEHGYKDDIMRKIGVVLSWIGLIVSIVILVITIAMLIWGIGLYGQMIGGAMSELN